MVLELGHQVIIGMYTAVKHNRLLSTF